MCTLLSHVICNKKEALLLNLEKLTPPLEKLNKNKCRATHMPFLHLTLLLIGFMGVNELMGLFNLPSERCGVVHL